MKKLSVCKLPQAKEIPVQFQSENTKRSASHSHRSPFARRLAVFALGFCLMANVGFAQSSGVSCSTIACGGEADVLISRVLPLDNGKILIDIVGHETESATMNCSLWQDRYITLNPDHPRLQENFATILTAIATGSTLTLRIVEGSNDCSLSYAALHT